MSDNEEGGSAGEDEDEALFDANAAPGPDLYAVLNGASRARRQPQPRRPGSV